ncbi:MAG TPA: hypothetical protein VF669_20105 [Tepidisphaeraceae bacterium]
MKRLVLAGVVLLGACAVWAAEPDVSTPGGAQRAAVAAMNKEDEKEVRKFLHAATPVEQKLADAMAANAVAGAKVYNAAVKKFGEEVTRKELVGLVPMQPADADMEKTQWKIDGDKATPVETGQQKFVQGSALRKVDNVWKMSVSDLRQGHSDPEISQMLGMIQKQTEMMSQTSKEIGEGKYATVNDLKKASVEKMRKLMQEVMAAGAAGGAAGGAATQQSATRPATAPSGGNGPGSASGSGGAGQGTK